MNTTQTRSPLSIIAARVSRGDLLDIEGYGDFRTVEDIAIRNCRVEVEFTDGTTASVAPHRYVEVMAR